MSNNNEENKQLSLDFEAEKVEKKSNAPHSTSGARSLNTSRLALVVNNHSINSRLTPDSAEITRILANQAQSLSW